MGVCSARDAPGLLLYAVGLLHAAAVLLLAAAVLRLLSPMLNSVYVSLERAASYLYE